ncbi:MAG: AsmA family protein [Candidatus Omnitrophota bacterium]
MKKFLLILFVLAALAAAGIAIFVATFDVNRFRPDLVKVLETSLGSPVEIGRIRLGWGGGGITAHVNGISIFRSEKEKDKPAAYLDRASVTLQLLPLLDKKIEIASILLKRPLINVFRDADGSVRVDGISPKAAEPGAAAPEKTAAAVSFLIGQVKIEDAEIGYYDLTEAFPARIEIRDADLVIRNLSFSGTAEFQGAFSLFSAEQNIRFKGRVNLAGPSGPYSLEDFEIESDLSWLDLEKMAASAPKLKDAGLRDPLKGKLSVGIGKLKMDAGVIQGLSADVKLQGGVLSHESMTKPLEEVDLYAVLTEKDLQISSFSSKFAQGSLSASGHIDQYLEKSPKTKLQFKVDRVSLKELLPAPKPGRPQVHGKFSVAFDGTGEGADWGSISRTINGSGKASLQDGVVLDLNILRLVVQHLSKIPGVSDALNAQLPPQYQQKIANPHTFIPPIEFPVNIQNGVLFLQDLRIPLDGYEIYGTGQFGLDGTIRCKVHLVIDQQLSAILMQNAQQLSLIADPYGRLAIPVNITGNVQYLRVKPDMDYVISRVVASKGQELLTQGLQKAIGKGGQTAGTGAGTAQSTAEQLLGGFFQ